jgi:hypothetical protein
MIIKQNIFTRIFNSSGACLCSFTKASSSNNLNKSLYNKIACGKNMFVMHEEPAKWFFGNSLHDMIRNWILHFYNKKLYQSSTVLLRCAIKIITYWSSIIHRIRMRSTEKPSKLWLRLYYNTGSTRNNSY